MQHGRTMLDVVQAVLGLQMQPMPLQLSQVTEKYMGCGSSGAPGGLCRL